MATTKSNTTKEKNIIDMPIEQYFASSRNELANTVNSNSPNYINNVQQMPTRDIANPTIFTGSQLADMYGVDYDYNSILGKLMEGIDAGYVQKYKDQDIAERNYYNQAATTQNTLTGTLNNMNSQAISAGVNKGMQAANALSTVLGVSKNFSDNALTLANNRSALSNQYATDVANARSQALNKSNELATTLGQLSSSLYGVDTSRYSAELGYNADVNTANSALLAQALASQAQYDTGMLNTFSDMLSSYMNGQLSKEQVAAQLEAAKEQAGATRYAADRSYAGQVEAANAYVAQQQQQQAEYAKQQQAYLDAINNGFNNQPSTQEIVEAVMAQLKQNNLSPAQAADILNSQGLGGIPINYNSALPSTLDELKELAPKLVNDGEVSLDRLKDLTQMPMLPKEKDIPVRVGDYYLPARVYEALKDLPDAITDKKTLAKFRDSGYISFNDYNTLAEQLTPKNPITKKQLTTMVYTTVGTKYEPTLLNHYNPIGIYR